MAFFFFISKTGIMSGGLVGTLGRVSCCADAHQGAKTEETLINLASYDVICITTCIMKHFAVSVQNLRRNSHI